jgi:hypothetical protein
MAGATVEVRGMGRPGSLEAALVSTINQLIVDLDFVVDAVNTADGGSIDIDPDDLLAGPIRTITG